jgi:hypothetical protein
MKRCYIAGKIDPPDTKIDQNYSNVVMPDDCISMFNCAKDVVKSLGYEPVCTIDYECKTRKEALEKSLELLKTCDLVYVIAGWEGSRGVAMEIATAAAFDIPIRYEDQWAGYMPTKTNMEIPYRFKYDKGEYIGVLDFAGWVLHTGKTINELEKSMLHTAADFMIKGSHQSVKLTDEEAAELAKELENLTFPS